MLLLHPRAARRLAVRPVAQCFDLLNGWNVAWMAVYNGNTGTGTAAYYPNGTLATWDPSGVLANAGNWTVTQVGCSPSPKGVLFGGN